MQTFRLFITATLLGGFGGLLGSVIGAAFGKQGFLGGFLGGIAIAPLTAWLSLWRQWIDLRQYWSTAFGAALGFLAAATVAINTLSSPVGSVLSTLLIGTGAILGSHLRR